VFAGRETLTPFQSRFVFAFLGQRDDEFKPVLGVGMTDHDPLRLYDLDRDILSGSRKARKTFCRDAFNTRVYANSGSAVFVDESESD